MQGASSYTIHVDSGVSAPDCASAGLPCKLHWSWQLPSDLGRGADKAALKVVQRPEAATEAADAVLLSRMHAGGSEQAAPSDVAHDAQEAEQADDEGDAVDRPELPHVLGDGLRQLQVLA